MTEKVYVVTKTSYGDCEVIGFAETEEKAKRICAEHNSNLVNTLGVWPCEEWTFNEICLLDDAKETIGNRYLYVFSIDASICEIKVNKSIKSNGKIIFVDKGIRVFQESGKYPKKYKVVVPMENEDGEQAEKEALYAVLNRVLPGLETVKMEYDSKKREWVEVDRVQLKKEDFKFINGVMTFGG